VTSTGFYAGTWSLASGAWSLASGGQTLSFTPSTGDLVVTVPEPATCIIAIAGLACGGYALSRRRTRARAPLRLGAEPDTHQHVCATDGLSRVVGGGSTTFIGPPT